MLRISPFRRRRYTVQTGRSQGGVSVKFLDRERSDQARKFTDTPFTSVSFGGRVAVYCRLRIGGVQRGNAL